LQLRDNPATGFMQHSDEFEQQLTGVLYRLYAAALRMTGNRTDAEDSLRIGYQGIK
jgi:DNA-directed RNA polymerase specialized sigma24 family protein